MIMKKKIFIILFCVPAIIFCQNSFNIDLKITDTLIIKKQHPYATKINLDISISNFQDTIFLYLFSKCVSTFVFWSDSIINFYSRNDVDFDDFRNHVGLVYQLVDENNEVISGDFIFIIRNPSKYNSTGTFVNSKQKYVKKRIKDENIHEHFLARYEINSPNQKVFLYPIFDEHHKELPKGVYYLYFVYSFNPKPQQGTWFEEIIKDDRTFKGSVVSNKVKLIVK
jgi:hypothetical protein